MATLLAKFQAQPSLGSELSGLTWRSVALLVQPFLKLDPGVSDNHLPRIRGSWQGLTLLVSPTYTAQLPKHVDTGSSPQFPVRAPG